MLLDQTLNGCQILPAESSTAGESNGVQPELGDVAASLDVDILRLIAVACVEEESIRTSAKEQSASMVTLSETRSDRTGNLIE
jgi:hypothetical protein